MRFSKIELRHLFICWIVLGLCFSIRVFFNKYDDPFTTTLLNFIIDLLLVLVAMGLGFLAHEIAHKAMAQRYNCWAEFRIWKPGLVIAVATAVLSFGNVLFFAPGAVHTLPTRELTEKEQGHISAAGPVANLLMAAIFLLLFMSRYFAGTAGDFMFRIPALGWISHPYNIFRDLGWRGFILNVWLAAFNLIPLGPLDGVAIFRWNKVAWGVLVALSWGALLLTAFGVL